MAQRRLKIFPTARRSGGRLVFVGPDATADDLRGQIADVIGVDRADAGGISVWRADGSLVVSAESLAHNEALFLEAPGALPSLDTTPAGPGLSFAGMSPVRTPGGAVSPASRGTPLLNDTLEAEAFDESLRMFRRERRRDELELSMSHSRSQPIPDREIFFHPGWWGWWLERGSGGKFCFTPTERSSQWALPFNKTDFSTVSGAHVAGAGFYANRNGSGWVSGFRWDCCGSTDRESPGCLKKTVPGLRPKAN